MMIESEGNIKANRLGKRRDRRKWEEGGIKRLFYKDNEGREFD